MKSTHILIFEHDILKYPPILSVVTFLLSQNKKVIIIGYCSDERFIKELITKGVTFHVVIKNKTSDHILKKFFKYFLFKRKVSNLLEKYNTKTSKVWLFGEQCAWLLHKLVYRFDCILYLFEMPSISVNLRYKLLSSSLDYREVLQSASKVICCEYNRAHITKSYFQLKELPIVIPNKPSYDVVDIDENIAEEYLGEYSDKKIILYQGIFNYPERKLDEICEAMAILSEEYILVLMGSDNWYKQKLKDKYASERIIFLPHIAAPNHLSITKRAYIGVLVYNSVGGNIENTLNTLYCAPNKIYEYAKFGIPMISNDVPALAHLFEKFKCGESFLVSDSKDIVKSLNLISSTYAEYSFGSKKMYDMVDMKDTYLKLV